jgi:hypothetical protein
MDIGSPSGDDLSGVVAATTADDGMTTRVYQYGAAPIGEFLRAVNSIRAAARRITLSRHKSLDFLRGYVRSAELFKDHAL